MHKDFPTVFRSRVERSDGCWMWTGTVRPDGYGTMWVTRLGALPARQMVMAHRISYWLERGELPPVLDHTCHESTCSLGKRCRHRLCVNPDHLVPSTTGDNSRRGYRANRDRTHCHRGHEFTPENTYLSPRGIRKCRACRILRGD